MRKIILALACDLLDEIGEISDPNVQMKLSLVCKLLRLLLDTEEN